jgi:hypothetical protein
MFGCLASASNDSLVHSRAIVQAVVPDMSHDCVTEPLDLPNVIIPTNHPLDGGSAGPQERKDFGDFEVIVIVVVIVWQSLFRAVDPDEFGGL